MEGGDERLFFTVTDLKQYFYCPRVVYYTYCLPLLRPTTYKMEAGAVAHEEVGDLERRLPVDYKHTARQIGEHAWRQLAAYGIMLEETWGAECGGGLSTLW